MSVSSIIAASGAVGGQVVSLSNQTVEAFSFNPNDAAAGIQLTSAGAFRTGSTTLGTTPSYSDVGGSPNEWASSPLAGVGSAYEARLATVSGTLSVGNADTWEALSSTRTYEVNRTILGTLTFTGTLEIRRAADSVVVASCSISLTADKSSI